MPLETAQAGGQSGADDGAIASAEAGVVTALRPAGPQSGYSGINVGFGVVEMRGQTHRVAANGGPNPVTLQRPPSLPGTSNRHVHDAGSRLWKVELVCQTATQRESDLVASRVAN
jgi:hypothetical protein